MDDSHESRNFTAEKSAGHDPGVSEDFGATGVFDSLPPSRVHASRTMIPAEQQARPDIFAELGISAPLGPTPAACDGLQQPTVHQVTVGGSTSAASTDLFALLQSPSAQEVVRDVPPPSSASAKPSGSLGATNDGFTQLLRTLGGSSSAAAATRPTEETPPSSASDPLRPNAGFTALLGIQTPASPSDPAPLKSAVSGTPPPAVTSSGEKSAFTQLLQQFPGTPSNAFEQRQSLNALDEIFTSPRPVDAGAYPVTSAPSASPRMPPAQQVYPESTPTHPPSSEGSFTQLISTLGQPSSGASSSADPYSSILRESSRPTAPVQEAVTPDAKPMADFFNPTPSTPPQPQVESIAEIGSITRFVRTLTEPSQIARPLPAYPVETQTPAPPSGGGSLFTQTYKTLDSSAATTPAPPVAPPPAYPSPAPLSATQPFNMPVSGSSYPAATPPAPMGATVSSGPSEVTRIINASKLREMQHPAVHGAEPVAVPPPPSPQQQPMQFAAPAAPAMPNLQWQQPQMPRAPAVGQPMQFGGGMPMPQYTPPPPPQMPAVPAPPAAQAPTAGGMQQYLPLLLIIIIFLLVVILVTVVLLLKH